MQGSFLFISILVVYVMVLSFFLALERKVLYYHKVLHIVLCVTVHNANVHVPHSLKTLA